MSVRKPAVHNDYAALPGSAKWGLTKAWIGPDHLLTLRLHGTAEHARRFYYEDITGIRCEVTRRGQVIGGVLLIAALLPLIPLAVFGLPATVSAILSGVWTSLWLLALVIHWGRGPCCITWLHTTNHTERLPSVRRYRGAEQACHVLAQRVATVQGEFPDGEGVAQSVTFAPLPGQDVVDVHGSEVPSFRVLTLSLSLSLVMALSYLLDYQINWDWKNALDSMACIVMVLATPFALYRCYRPDITPLLRGAIIVLTIFFATLFPQMFGLMMLLAALDPGSFEVAAEKVGTIAGLTVSDGPVYYLMLGYHTLSILIMGGCAIVGLLVLLRKTSVQSPLDEVSN